jgi:hypothetical protein
VLAVSTVEEAELLLAMRRIGSVGGHPVRKAWDALRVWASADRA